VNDIPAVCYIDDLVRILRMSRRSIARLRRHRVFPIRELAGFGGRPRWAGAEVQRFLEGQQSRESWRRRA
jgi:hypothetical protein